MKKGMVFGTFDHFHSGHINFFKQAKKYGSYLIAVVARDKTVKKIKKHFPLWNEKERLKIVQNSELVDKAILGNFGNPYRVIKKFQPDIICLGYDQKAFVENLPKELKKMGLKTKIYRMKPYKPEKYHSSKTSV